MEQKIDLGEVTVAEYNVLMQVMQLGRLGECIDLFMRFRQIGMDFQNRQNTVNLEAADAA